MVSQNHKLNRVPRAEVYPFDVEDLVKALYFVLSHPKIGPGVTITIADLGKIPAPKDDEGAVDFRAMVKELFHVQQYKTQRTIRIVAKPFKQETIVVPDSRIIS